MGKGIEQISLQDIQTAKKHMERDLTSSAIREMHTKTTIITSKITDYKSP